MMASLLVKLSYVELCKVMQRIILPSK